MTAMVCGFQWKGRETTHENLATELHVHECQQEHEDDPYIPESHVCYCGDSRERERGEVSYEPDPKFPLMDHG